MAFSLVAALRVGAWGYDDVGQVIDGVQHVAEKKQVREVSRKQKQKQLARQKNLAPLAPR